MNKISDLEKQVLEDPRIGTHTFFNFAPILTVNIGKLTDDDRKVFYDLCENIMTLMNKLSDRATEESKK